MMLTKMSTKLLTRLATLSLLLIAVLGGRLSAQTLRQRLSLQMESSFNRSKDFHVPAAMSLGSEVKYWVTNKFYAGLRLDVGLGSFGDNNYSIYLSGSSADFNYVEANLATMASLSIKGYYEFRFLKSRMFIGYGIGHFFGGGLIGYKYLRSGANAPSIGFSRYKPAWLVCRAIGIRGDRVNFSITSNTSSKVGTYGRRGSVVNHLAYTLGFEFGNGKKLSQF
ncbi:MAG: hypothetical protein IT258_20155, partial [Saprospiraceae bacterium]|nr:hypothetical protein [Saprospiraceae bacterium]